MDSPASGQSATNQRALVIGQASVNIILGIATAPLPDRAYPVLCGPLYPGDTGSCPHEVRQIGGQMLVPATFLDRWEVPVAFASVIGDDEYGLELRDYLRGLKRVDASYVEIEPRIPTEHSYILTFEGARTIIDCGVRHTHPEAARRFLSRIQSDLTQEKLAARVIYLSRWDLDTCAPGLEEWCKATPRRPLVLYETGSKGSEDPESLEARFAGRLCDVVLSSGLFALRFTRMPLWSPEGDRFVAAASRRDWDARLRAVQAKAESGGKSYGNAAFARVLQHLGIEGVHRFLFDSAFCEAAWWIVALGKAGMVAFGRERPGEAIWVPAPSVTVRNALGCGDVSRAAFIGWFMRAGLERAAFLTDADAVCAATRQAVAAGSHKGEYFSLQQALASLSWDALTQKALALQPHALSDVRNMEQFQAVLRA